MGQNTLIDLSQLANNLPTLRSREITTFDPQKEIKRLIPTNSGLNAPSMRCWWDHHPFTGEGIGCPIKYITPQATHKGKYKITENYPKHRTVSETPTLHINTTGYYECEGLFCSVECCLAYIRFNLKFSIKYIDSERYLYTMLDLKEPVEPANSFETLIPYGGFLSIEAFRKNNIPYTKYATTVPIQQLLIKKCIG